MKKKIVNGLNNKVISMILIIICVVFFVFIGFVISREIFVYNVANKNLINYLQNELTSKASEIDRINKTPIYGGKLLNDIEFTYKDKIITNYVTYQEIVNNYGLKNNITKELSVIAKTDNGYATIVGFDDKKMPQWEHTRGLPDDRFYTLLN